MSGVLRRGASLLLAGLFATFAGGGVATAQLALGQKHDNSQPIEISADSLEVEQDKQIATFRGKVDAIQGEMHLRADTLVVHYRQKGDAGSKAPQAKSPPKTGGAGGDPFGGGAISRIDASGNVFVSSPEETAQGDTGVYDVD